MPKIDRTIVLKAIMYRSRGDTFTPLPIDALLRTIWKKAPLAQDRHVPALATLEEGGRGVFVDGLDNPIGGAPGVTFICCTYRKGHCPPGMDPDLSKPRAVLGQARLTDARTGQPRESVSVMHVLAWGQIVVLDLARGAGGIGLLEDCLTDLLRQHIDPKHPRAHLVDVLDKGVRQQIKRAGGVQEVIMDVAASKEDASHTFGRTLHSAQSAIRGAGLVTLSYKAAKDGSLNQNDVLQAYEDLEASELDRLVVVLNNGTVLKNMNRCVERRVVRLERFAGGAVDEFGLMKAMAAWVTELQIEKDGVRVLTEHGSLA